LVKLLKSAAADAAKAEEDLDPTVPHDFTLAEGSEPGSFTFTRTLNGEKITISGNANDIQEADNQDQEDEGTVDEEEDDQGEVGVPVTIELQKGGKTLNISATAWGKSGWSLSKSGRQQRAIRLKLAISMSPY